MRSVVLPALLLSSLLTGQVAAGPAVVSTESTTDTTVPGVEAQQAPDGGAGNRTIDRLLKLQDSAPADAARATSTQGRSTLRAGAIALKADNNEAAASVASPLAAMQAAIVGKRETAAQSTTYSTQGPQRLGEREDSLGSFPAKAGSMDSRNPGFSEEDRVQGPLYSTIQFVREHRTWVIAASLASLVAIWAAASFSSQRRR